MASPQQLDLLAHDAAAGKPGAPDLTAQGSFAPKADAPDARLPVVAAADDNGDGEGAAAAKPGSTAKSSQVHALGLQHPVVEVMVTSHAGARVLLRRRPADDPLAPDTFDVSASAHLLPEDKGDAVAAARRALASAGLADAGGAGGGALALKPLPGAPERRERLEFPVGGFVENVLVHGFVCEVEEAEAGAAAAEAAAKGPDGAERAWLSKADALRMLEEDPAVCSPFLAAGKKAWFAAA